MREYKNVSAVKDGSIIRFDASACTFMKVCDRNGTGGVVRLSSGQYLSLADLDYYGIGRECYIIVEN